MFKEGGISFEVSEKMALTLVSCFEMVGLPAPSHITSDKMAIVVDKIRTSREKLKQTILFSEEEGGKIKEESSLKLNNTQVKLITTLNKEKEAQKKCFIQQNKLQREKVAVIASKLGIIRSQLKLLLKYHNYKVIMLNSIEELDLVLRNKEFDLIVTEIHEQRDINYLGRIKKLLKPGNIFIVLSSETENDDITKYCNKVGVDVFIEKAPEWQKRLLLYMQQYKEQTANYA